MYNNFNYFLTRLFSFAVVIASAFYGGQEYHAGNTGPAVVFVLISAAVASWVWFTTNHTAVDTLRFQSMTNRQKTNV